ncbi:MAG: hypothetical protein BWY06_02190 [Candidatus Latescibacteria bacterium ADurb.Bin168]|nr:MAG: hypothetical protein BWY06_02190 [Candidatus Latescibacteria bacterium ADurb.Bin168]
MRRGAVVRAHPAVFATVTLLYFQAALRQRAPRVERFRADAKAGILHRETRMFLRAARAVLLRKELEDGLHRIEPDLHAIEFPRFVEASLAGNLTFQQVLPSVDPQDTIKAVKCLRSVLLHLQVLQRCPDDVRTGGDKFDPHDLP